MARSLFGRPSKSAYKAAVSQIIRDIKASYGLSNNRLSEILVCDEKTIRNAEDGDNGALDPVILLNIAYAFGEEAIHPVRELYLCAPVDQPTKSNLIRKAIGLLSKAEAME